MLTRFPPSFILGDPHSTGHRCCTTTIVNLFLLADRKYTVRNRRVKELCGILMDTNNSRPTTVQVAEPSVETVVDWRTQLPNDARQRIANKILETLKRHIPFSGQEGLEDLKKIAVRFEEKMYTAAQSQSDYLRKISLKMLTLESGSQTTIPNSLPSNPSDFLLEVFPGLSI